MSDDTTTTTPKMRTITLTDCPPVRIREDHWPVIAQGSADDDDSTQPGNPPNREWTRSIRVRAHADGRAIVYGIYDYETCFQGEHGAAAKRGLVLEASATSADLIAAIRSVGAALAEAESVAAITDAQREPRQWDEAIQGCIADLPAIEI